MQVIHQSLLVRNYRLNFPIHNLIVMEYFVMGLMIGLLCYSATTNSS